SLSTGQRQRLSLAMALLRPSRVLLLDEPERGLDAAFRKRLAGLLAEYAADGGAVVMVTHDQGFSEDARRVALEAAACTAPRRSGRACGPGTAGAAPGRT